VFVLLTFKHTICLPAIFRNKQTYLHLQYFCLLILPSIYGIMVDVQPAAAMNWGVEDELYMNRRHAVAMEGLEEELEEGEVPPLVDEEEEQIINQLNVLLPEVGEILPDNPFEEGADYVQLPPELEAVDEDVNQHMRRPLERQHAVDPFQEDEMRRIEEWKQRNYEAALDPNSRWESINHNHLWREDPHRARIQWQFPSPKMQQVDKASIVLSHLLQVHRDNRRLLAPREELPVPFRNRFLGIYLQCADCRCCERHMRNRPEFCAPIPNMPFDYQFRELIDGQKENNCICPCRHIMRAHNRLMNNY